MNLLVKDAVALLLAAFGLIATTRWLLMRCYSPPQPATLARLAHAVHSAGRQQRKRDVAETATLLNATAHLRMPVGVWHALAPSGRCPAPIPTWDWQLLLAAARAERSHERYQAMERLRASSSLAYGELVQLVHRYRAKLRDPEFAHILDPSHARCGGRRPKRGQSGALVVPQLLCPGLLRLALQGPGCATASNGRLRCCCAARSKPPIPWATTPTPHHHPPPPPSRFASLDSRRMLRLECEAGERASFALDAEQQRHPASSNPNPSPNPNPNPNPDQARVERAGARGRRDGARPALFDIPRGGRRAEPATRVIAHDVRSSHPGQVLAFCGEELNMLARPARPHTCPAPSPQPESQPRAPAPAVAAAPASAQAWAGAVIGWPWPTWA